MFRHILKRLAVSIILILGVFVLTFMLMQFVPGNPFYSERSTPEQIQYAKEKYDLDKPLLIQLKTYFVNYLKGDMGVSLKMQEGMPVSDILFHQGKFVTSIKLGLLSLLVAVLFGVPLGVLAAMKDKLWLDNILRTFTSICTSTPTFVLSALLVYIFSVKIRWLPSISGNLDSIESLVLPVICLSNFYFCYIYKLTKSSMTDVMKMDYIVTAKAKGLSKRRILYKHALFNALTPIITYIGPATVGLITGSFVVESIFSVPGMGRYFIQSILSRDYPIIMATTIIYSVLIALSNLVIDIIYRLIDPRVSFK